MLKCVVAAFAVMWALSASAAEQPRYVAPAAWVRPASIPNIPASTDGSATQILLLDSQSRFGAEADDFYVESAARLLTPQALASVASISLNWDPATETLDIHRIAIIRAGKTIDLVDAGKNVTVLRRESQLELSILDGRLTATVQPKGLQVGDVLDIAMTLERRDPVFQGRSQFMSGLRFPGTAGRVRIRGLWPASKALKWRVTAGVPQPVISKVADTDELVIDARNLTAPVPPENAPTRFADVGLLEVSQFGSWAEVSALMAPLYEKAATLAPGSPLDTEIAKIRAASSDPKSRAEAALRLVQDKVHYVFLGMNLGGYVPASADLTWSRRFGDCKGKTALLLAVLHGLGIEAEPALVNTAQGDALDQRLPMLVFDHVFVRAVINGKVYWLDGTRSGDRDLDDIPIPNFRWVLPVQPKAAKLEKVEPKPLQLPAFESLKQIDASAGYDAPAKAHVEQLFRGDTAVAWQIGLSAVGEKDSERRLKEYWRGQMPWLEPRSVAFAYDDQRRVMRLTVEGEGKMDWSQHENVRDYDIADSNLGFNTSFRREPGPNSDAPIAVPFPTFSKWVVSIRLPGNGGGFRLRGPLDVDTIVAGRHYVRHSRMDGATATMTAQEQSVASEFPYADAEAASLALRKLASLNVYVRGDGGPATEGLRDEDDDLTSKPADAAGFSRRGMAFMSRHDYDHAIADFTAAAALQPGEGKHRYNAGAARFAKHDDAGALADFNEALRLNPKDALAHAARAELLLSKGDSRQAWSDYDAAVKLAPSNAGILERRSQAYERAGRYADAVHDLDTLLARAPRAGRLTLLNTRCWVRAEWGQELPLALADCDAALALAPSLPAVLDSRGFVELRMGQYDKAVADYDRVLSQSPDMAPSLFGRGLAKLRQGKKPDAVADFAAARKDNPAIDAQFARYGEKAEGN